MRSDNDESAGLRRIRQQAPAAKWRSSESAGRRSAEKFELCLASDGLPFQRLSGAVCRRWAVDDRVLQLLATDVALDKLGARGIVAAEAEQLLRNTT